MREYQHGAIDKRSDDEGRTARDREGDRESIGAATVEKTTV